MNPSFLLVYEKLERQRNQLMELLKDVPAEKINAAPASKWSIEQILLHLLTSEKMTVGYMKKKALAIDTLKDSSIKHTFLLNLLKISQRIPLRYKAPVIVIENTPTALSFEEIDKQWKASRLDLEKFLNSISEEHGRRLVAKHPVTGRMNAMQAIAFMVEHINHHLPQIRKLLKN